MTVGETFDLIRDALGVVPAVDAGGLVGNATTTEPRPTDGRCLRALNNVRAEVNRRCNIGSDTTFTNIPFSAATANGPATLNIARGIGGLATGKLRGIRTAYWTGPAPDDYRRMWVETFESMVRMVPMWFNMSPGSPSWVWLDGTELSVLPPPCNDGVLHVTALHCLLRLTSKAETIDDVPDDCVPVLADMAARDIAASYPDDVEMRSRLQALAPKSDAGVLQISEWLSRQNEGHDVRFFVATGRM